MADVEVSEILETDYIQTCPVCLKGLGEIVHKGSMKQNFQNYKNEATLRRRNLEAEWEGRKSKKSDEEIVVSATCGELFHKACLMTYCSKNFKAAKGPRQKKPKPHCPKCNLEIMYSHHREIDFDSHRQKRTTQFEKEFLKAEHINTKLKEQYKKDAHVLENLRKMISASNAQLENARELRNRLIERLPEASEETNLKIKIMQNKKQEQKDMEDYIEKAQVVIELMQNETPNVMRMYLREVQSRPVEDIPQHTPIPRMLIPYLNQISQDEYCLFAFSLVLRPRSYPGLVNVNQESLLAAILSKVNPSLNEKLSLRSKELKNCGLQNAYESLFPKNSMKVLESLREIRKASEQSVENSTSEGSNVAITIMYVLDDEVELLEEDELMGDKLTANNNIDEKLLGRKKCMDSGIFKIAKRPQTVPSPFHFRARRARGHEMTKIMSKISPDSVVKLTESYCGKPENQCSPENQSENTVTTNSNEIIQIPKDDDLPATLQERLSKEAVLEIISKLILDSIDKVDCEVLKYPSSVEAVEDLLQESPQSIDEFLERSNKTYVSDVEQESQHEDFDDASSQEDVDGNLDNDEDASSEEEVDGNFNNDESTSSEEEVDGNFDYDQVASYEEEVDESFDNGEDADADGPPESGSIRSIEAELDVSQQATSLFTSSMLLTSKRGLLELAIGTGATTTQSMSSLDKKSNTEAMIAKRFQSQSLSEDSLRTINNPVNDSTKINNEQKKSKRHSYKSLNTATQKKVNSTTNSTETFIVNEYKSTRNSTPNSVQNEENLSRKSTENSIPHEENSSRNSTANSITNSIVHSIRNTTANSVRNSTADSITNSAANSVRNATANSVRNSTANSVRNSTANSVRNSTANSIGNTTAISIRNTTADSITDSPSQLNQDVEKHQRVLMTPSGNVLCTLFREVETKNNIDIMEATSDYLNLQPISRINQNLECQRSISLSETVEYVRNKFTEDELHIPTVLTPTTTDINDNLVTLYDSQLSNKVMQMDNLHCVTYGRTTAALNAPNDPSNPMYRGWADPQSFHEIQAFPVIVRPNPNYQNSSTSSMCSQASQVSSGQVSNTASALLSSHSTLLSNAELGQHIKPGQAQMRKAHLSPPILTKFAIECETLQPLPFKKPRSITFTSRLKETVTPLASPLVYLLDANQRQALGLQIAKLAVTIPPPMVTSKDNKLPNIVDSLTLIKSSNPKTKCLDSESKSSGCSRTISSNQTLPFKPSNRLGLKNLYDITSNSKWKSKINTVDFTPSTIAIKANKEETKKDRELMWKSAKTLQCLLTPRRSHMGSTSKKAKGQVPDALPTMNSFVIGKPPAPTDAAKDRKSNGGGRNGKNKIKPGTWKKKIFSAKRRKPE